MRNTEKSELQIRASEEATLKSNGYKLVKKLGEGSYAQVFLTEFTGRRSSINGEDNNRKLACKIIDITKASKDFVSKFLPRELDILIRIHHPHIIHIHSIFQRKTKYFIFMRHAEQGDLLEFIIKKGPVSESQSRVWTRQLALAIQYLHEMDVAHRDLKCENCLITSNFNLKVADFGFSRFVIDKTGKRLTSATYCGSLSYAAPEVLRGIPYYPKIADMWSIGVIIYIMVNKAMPFDETNVKKLHEQQVNKRFKFRSRIINTISDDLSSAVYKLLEPDITKRWKITNILNSEWMRKDPRLIKLNPPEEEALAQARIERQSYMDGAHKIPSMALERRTTTLEEIKGFKRLMADKHDGKSFSKGLLDGTTVSNTDLLNEN